MMFWQVAGVMHTEVSEKVFGKFDSG